MTATTTPTSTGVAHPSPRSGVLARVHPGVVVTAEAALAAILTSHALGRRSFWFDETATAQYLDRSFGHLLRNAVLTEPTVGFYYVIAKIWSITGHTEAALRSLSVVAAIAVVPVVYLLTRRLFGTASALVAGLLVAVNTTVVALAHLARPYALVLLLVSGASLCFVRAVRRPSSTAWLLYAFVAALAVYAHFLASFVIVGHLASLLVLRRPTVPWRSVTRAAAIVAVLVLPLVIAIRRHGTRETSFIKPTTLDDVTHTFEAFAGGTWYLLLACGAAAAVALAAGFAGWRRSHNRAQAWPYAFLVAWLLVPVIGALVVSLWRPIFIDRYVIGALPALLILTAVGISAIRPRWIRTGFLIGLVVANLAVLANWFEADSPVAHTPVPREDWRGAVAYVLARSRSTDAVVMQQGHLTPAWDYYLKREGTPRNAPPLLSDYRWRAPLVEQQLRSIGNRHTRVWVLVGEVEASKRPAIRARFAERYDLASTRHFVGPIDVLRYDQRG